MTDAPFESFVVARYQALLRFGFLLTGDREAAQDVLQTALVRTAMRWRAVRDAENPEPYVRRAMVNVWSNSRRHRWWERPPAGELPEQPAPFEAERSVDDRDQVWAALLGLPPRQRAVIVLRYYEQLSEAEIADVLGCSRGTVKSQASKALAHLREMTGIADGLEACR